jgi:serine/threonine-protein kinase
MTPVPEGKCWPPGFRLASYEIVAFVGAGGMGEVYRASDTKLRRDVAIKVLPREFQGDPSRMTRFEREAQVLASLNHPHIAAIYGLEVFQGVPFLVLELVEGQTLAERITRGPLPPNEALAIATQIIEALEYAHERNVIHRDLKPANIKVTPDGSVKVLDFGLAKALADPAPASDPADSPTLTIGRTVAGVILGTAAYMSPEQAQGKPLDKRTDIWSFGIVLYEMLIGKPPFRGETVAETLASILKEPPDLDRIPAKARPLLLRCLEKDRKRRLRDIGDGVLLLELSPHVQHATRRRPWLLGVAVAIVLAALVAIGWWRAARPVLRPLMRISAELTPTGAYGIYRLDSETILAKGPPGTFLALSPDGTRLVVEVRDPDGKIRLATRRLDANEFTILAGTENPASPFFSPDGQWLGFFSDGKLKKIPAEGGEPVTLCEAGPFTSGSWGDDGNIVASLAVSGGLSWVRSSSGAPTPITQLQAGEYAHRWPQVLPGSSAVLFTTYANENVQSGNIEVLSLRSHKRKILVYGAVMGRYLPMPNGIGYLVYLRQNTLLAAPFDLRKLSVTGQAQPVLRDVGTITATSPGEFDFSSTGTFVYVSGKGDPPRSIFWLDSSGKVQPLHPAPGFYQSLLFSPDGKRLAYAVGRPGHSDVWVQDLDRGHLLPLITLPEQTRPGAWTPDSKHYVARGESSERIYWINADGSGQPVVLSGSGVQGMPSSISPDRKWLATWQGGRGFAIDIWTVPIAGDPEHPQLGKAMLFAHSPGIATSPVFAMPSFSPDGNWIAYASGETGESEAYVRPFPGPGREWPISTEYGQFPMWSPNGRELFFLTRDQHILVVDYTAKNNEFVVSKPRIWSEQRFLRNPGGGPFPPVALSPDGKRFAVMLYPNGTAESPNSLRLTFLLNFSDELQRRVSVR